MHAARYKQADEDGQLTDKEIAQGYHFCPDWDFLLIGPDMKGEWDCCTCYGLKERVKTRRELRKLFIVVTLVTLSLGVYLLIHFLNSVKI